MSEVSLESTTFRPNLNLAIPQQSMISNQLVAAARQPYVHCTKRSVELRESHGVSYCQPFGPPNQLNAGMAECAKQLNEV